MRSCIYPPSCSFFFLANSYQITGLLRLLGEHDIAEGLATGRRLLLRINELGLPCGMVSPGRYWQFADSRLPY